MDTNPTLIFKWHTLLSGLIMTASLLSCKGPSLSDSGQEGWQVYSKNPVIPLGDSNQWDAGALGSMSVIRVGDTLHMYYEAWGVRTDTAWSLEEYLSLQIGHATSTDGFTWTKDPENPVIPGGKESEWDRDGTWDPFLIYEDNVFKMWYGGGAQNHCEWGYAESSDGTHFTKKGQISQLGKVEEDHVVHDTSNQKYYMYYWNRQFEPMGLFRAESPNETDFEFKNAINLKIVEEEYPGMYKFTHVIKQENTWYMIYSNFVRPGCEDATVRLAISVDGLNWVSKNKNLLEGMDGEILEWDINEYMMYYGPAGYFDQKGCDIRLAFYKGRLEDLILPPYENEK